MQLGAGRAPCVRGAATGVALSGGSGADGGARFSAGRFAAGGRKYLPILPGMLVFDKWACNTNGRQAMFFFEPGKSRRQAMMIDQGFCFNAGEWNFPDAPLRGLYLRHRVYER